MKKFSFPIILGMVAMGMSVFGQTPPQFPTRTGTVLEPVVTMSFGDFTIPVNSSGGSLTVGTDGSRTPGGDVYLLNMGTPVRAAMFEFKLCPGRTITVYYPTNAQLQGTGGSNGFGYLELKDLNFKVDGGTIDDSGTGYIKFTSNTGCNDVHRIYMGGTLKVRPLSYNPSGTYHTDVSLTIVQK
ncbi:MAG: DUF4402 domain-containing protein [Bacteroidota bacterium]|nr:DUF4402 domain-containing protein [Bacteroidota bacterium]